MIPLQRLVTRSQVVVALPDLLEVLVRSLLVALRHRGRRRRRQDQSGQGRVGVGVDPHLLEVAQKVGPQPKPVALLKSFNIILNGWPLFGILPQTVEMLLYFSAIIAMAHSKVVSHNGNISTKRQSNQKQHLKSRHLRGPGSTGLQVKQLHTFSIGCTCSRLCCRCRGRIRGKVIDATRR